MEHPLPEGRKKYTKTKPLQHSEFEPLVTWWGARVETDHAWRVDVGQVVAKGGAGNLTGVNLDLKNPRANANVDERSSSQIAIDLDANERTMLDLIGELRALVAQTPAAAEI